MYIDARLMQKYFTYEKSQVKSKIDDKEKEEKAIAFRDKLHEIRLVISSKEEESAKANEANAPLGESIYRNKDDLIGNVDNEKLFNAWLGGMDIEGALDELDGNLGKIGDFSLTKGIGVQEAIEHLASQYSVYKNHIAKNGNAEQQKNLDALIEKHTEKYAKQFSDTVGGFFEENGLQSEKNRMYTSVKEHVRLLSKAYDSHIDKNSDAFNSIIDKTQKEGKSLAFELRKAYMQNGERTIDSQSNKLAYSKKELSEAVSLVKLSSEISKSGTSAEASEEELGVELGKLVLRGLVLLGTSSATSDHKDAFMKSLGTRLTQLMDGSDNLLEAEKAKEKEETQLYKPLNRDTVLSIVRLMSEHYIETGSVEKSIRIGEEYGLRSYLSKADSTGEVERYRSSPYWENIQSSIGGGGKRGQPYKMALPPNQYIPLGALFDSVRLDYRA